jgi:hypothetical protein
MTIAVGRRSGLVAACFGLAAVLIVGVASSRGAPQLPTRERMERVPIRDAVLACPPAAAGKGVDTELDLLAQPLPRSASQPAGTPRAHASPLSAPPGKSLLKLSARGRLAILRLERAGLGESRTHSIIAEATGPLATGLQAWLQANASGGDDSGLAVARCLFPSNQWWFVGTGAKFGHVGRLVLTNADPGASNLNLSVYGPKGELSAVGLDGIPLAPHSTKVVNLTHLAPRQANLAVAVTTTQGRVYASVRDRWITGLTPSGVDWPSATTPSTDLVIPGILDGNGTNRVVVANPGGSAALVSVELLGANGRFVPKGLARLQLDPGQVVSRDLTELAGRDAVSVHLTADQPVLGAVETAPGGPGNDWSVLGGVAPLGGPASVPLPASGALHLLLASAGRHDASATVVVMSRRGTALAKRDITLDGGTTVQRAPPHVTKAQRKRAAYLMIRPNGSVAVAAFYQAAGGAVAAVPVANPTLTVEQPTAHLVLTGG